MKNIAIIGGGWIGCHLALELRKTHNITIFEKESSLFTCSSVKNQNRLHLGFHYPRCSKTRNLCLATLNDFRQQYGFCIEEIANNVYSIPIDKSMLDFVSYLNQYDNYKEIDLQCLANIEGSIVVDEAMINPIVMKEYFNGLLSSITKFNANVDIQDLAKEYDYVINCTNNTFEPIGECKYETCLTHVYKVKKDLPFGALTLMDGKLFSIFPYIEDTYTVTDVEHTPVYSSTRYSDLQLEIPEDVKVKKRNLIENKIQSYFTEFNEYFEYSSNYTSIKCKTINSTDNRYPVVQVDKNVITTFTGKIQGIFIIENKIKDILK